MTNRRNQLFNFYSNPADQRKNIIEKAAVGSSRYEYKGEAVAYSVVVRVDLNGYSKWAIDKSIADRVNLLNDFFRKLYPCLMQAVGYILGMKVIV